METSQEVTQQPVISDHEFQQFSGLIHRIAGISMSPAKKLLVSGRLARRLRHHRLQNFGEYFRLLNESSWKDELQIAVDLLTTNETYFFREPKHFDFMREQVLPGRVRGDLFRVWSAASSSGQEAYSITMSLAEILGENAAWEVVASDISSRVLEIARSGIFPLEQSRHIPPSLLNRYCLKGVGDSAGTFMIDRSLRQRVQFMQINLNQELPRLGMFDLVFLRNVMIYFNQDTKRKVVGRICSCLKPGGYLFIGHSENLNGLDGIDTILETVKPSMYRKPAR